MNRVIVVGGGFAGLSTAVYLSENDFQVTLLEASPKLGGRAYSLSSKANNDIYDNGQHILMGCYEETLAFLNKIEALDKLNFQHSLSIPFVHPNGSVYKLNSPKYLYPFNLLIGIMNYKVLSFKERFKIIDFFLDLMCCASCDLKNKTVAEWLSCKKQSENSKKAFWEILVVGVMNTTIEKASAEMFSDVLKAIFLNGNTSAAILLPSVGLTQLYVEDSMRFINKRNGVIKLSEKVVSLETNKNEITKLVTNKNSYENFDYIVFTVPPYALERIFSESNEHFEPLKFHYSPIINVHFWLMQNSFKEKFYGLIDSKIHWVFNHGSHISLTSSAAEELVLLEDSEIKKLFSSELEKYFPIFHKEIVTDSIVIKEKRATFVPDIASNHVRNNFSYSTGKMMIAGDWINTGLPATIESAVLSGKIAAGKVINSLK
ncbi:hypothetical protein C0389_02970 [bacterium]|nr:hypothetical protein [bacterium]